VQYVAVVTDTIACLTREHIQRYRIRVVPAKFSVNGHEYRDSVDISSSEAYRLLEEDPEYFATSAASPTEILEAFREASNTARHILCITVSSRLSAQHDMAQLALELARQELPQTSAQLLDSRNAAAAEGLITLAAARAAAEGKSPAEVVSAAQDVIGRIRFFAVLETMRYVHRTGRVPRFAVRTGSALNVRPILTCSDGVIRFAGVARTKQRGLNRIVQTMRNQVGDSPVYVAVMHADAPDEAESLKQRVASEFNCSELWVSEFSPLMGYATGRGLLGLTFYVEG